MPDGLPEWETGRFLSWSADALVFVSEAADTMLIPGAMSSDLLVEKVRDYRWLGLLTGAALGAAYGAVTFEPKYGHRRGDFADNFWCAVEGASCDLPVEQINSRAEDLGPGPYVGSLIGFLTGWAIKGRTWEPLSGTTVSTSASPSGTQLQVRFMTR